MASVRGLEKDGEEQSSEENNFSPIEDNGEIEDSNHPVPLGTPLIPFYL